MLKKFFIPFYLSLFFTLATSVFNTAMALGLGEITVHSALNEPLNVEIDIINTDSVAIDDITVRNATRETYQRADLLNPEIFNKVRFKIIKKPDGSLVVRLTSKKPVKEPFITFIADMRWRTGHFNREYTFLLDPPKFVQKQTRLKHQKTHKSSARSVAKSKTAETPVIPGMAKKHHKSQPKDYSTVIANHRSERTYTTRRSDTLWEIAKNTRPDNGVSTYQTMQAIFVLNQDAFIHGDINLLKQRQTLTLPDSDEVRQINGKAPLKVSHTGKTSSSENYTLKPQKSPSRVIEPSRSNKIAANTANDEQARLKIIPPAETLLNKPVTSKKDLLLINRALKTSMDTIKLLQTENKLLNTQVDNLNEKINNLDSHNLELNHKITEITQLLKDIRTDKNQSKTKISANKAIAKEQDRNIAEPVVESKISVASAARASEPSAAGINIESTASQTQNNQSFFKEILNNPLFTIALAILAIIILIASYLSLTRQKAGREDNMADLPPSNTPTFSQNTKQSTVLSSHKSVSPVNNETATKMTSSNTVVVEKNEDDMDFFEYFEKKINSPDDKSVSATEPEIDDSSEIDLTLDISEQDIDDYEQSLSDSNTPQADKDRPIADILSEIDTYIAYGNYNTAEDILTSEIIKSPLNKDLNLKLFECYALENKRYEYIQHVKQTLNLLNEHMVLRHRVENVYQQTWNEPLDITQLS